MRFTTLVAAAGLSLTCMTLPAEAAWKSYINHALSFSFTAPGEVKAENAKYRSAIAGQRDAIVYRSVDDNVEYKATVVDFSDRPTEGATLMEEAAFLLQRGTDMLMNDFGRVEGGKDAVYGRKMTFNLRNNGGRRSVETYFTKGRLYMLEATVLPANGDYTTPDTGRFLDSLVFTLTQTEPGATELEVPK